jgi:segregation and condensation protein A
MFELLDAFREVLKRAEMYQHHRVLREPLSVRERMTRVLERVSNVGPEGFASFESLFEIKEGRMGLVVTFLAVLELLKESLIVIVQHEPFAPIHVKAAA